MIGLFAIKGLLLYHLIRRLGSHARWLAKQQSCWGKEGICLFSRGVGFVRGINSDPTAQFMLIITSITMFATPIAAGVTRRLVRLQASPNDDDPIDGEDLFQASPATL